MTDGLTQTTPTGRARKRLGLPGEGGNELPVPTRGEVMTGLHKIATADHDDEGDETAE